MRYGTIVYQETTPSQEYSSVSLRIHALIRTTLLCDVDDGKKNFARVKITHFSNSLQALKVPISFIIVNHDCFHVLRRSAITLLPGGILWMHFPDMPAWIVIKYKGNKHMIS